MPRNNHFTRCQALPEVQSRLLADACTTRASVTRLSRRLKAAKRPRAATVRELAEAASRLAWQSDLIAEWYTDNFEGMTAAETEAERARIARSQRIDNLFEEIDNAHAALFAPIVSDTCDAFEKHYCHPADTIEAALIATNARQD